jgi:hypothetical protein
MKRKRRLPFAKRPSNLRVEQDVATDTTSGRSGVPRARYGTMKLPHERDEDTHASGPPSDVITKGARDVEQGRLDTDCYTAVGERHDRRRGEH